MFCSTGMAAIPVLVQQSAQPPSRTLDLDSNAGSKSDSVHQDSSTSSQGDVPNDGGSRPTSTEASSEHCDSKSYIDEMMTRTNILVLPPSNPSYQMAYFLKTTGPSDEPTRKVSKPKKISSAIRMLKPGKCKLPEALSAAHQRLNDALTEKCEVQQTEPILPDAVVQKVSNTGKKYLQIGSNVEPPDAPKPAMSPSKMVHLSPEIVESRVSVFVSDQLSSDNLDNWVLAFDDGEEVGGRGRALSSTKIADENTIRLLDPLDNTPGSAATPVPIRIGAAKHHASQAVTPLGRHPVEPYSIPEMSPTSVLEAKSLSAKPISSSTVQIIHPSPRRMSSHPVLLQRPPANASDFDRVQDSVPDHHRSFSDNAAAPPPRSPLRIQTDPETIESLLMKTAARLESTKEKQSVQSRCDPSDGVRFTEEPVMVLPDSDQQAVSSSANSTINDIASSTKRGQQQTYSKPLDIIAVTTKPSQSGQTRKRLRRARPEEPKPQDANRTGVRDQVVGPAKANQLATRRLSMLGDVSENVRAVSAIYSPSPKPGFARGPTNSVMKGRKSPGVRARSGKSARTTKSLTPRATSPERRTLWQEVPASPPPSRELPPTPVEVSHRSTYSAQSIGAALARKRSTDTLPSPPSDEKINKILFPSSPSSTVSPTKSKTTRQHSGRKVTSLEERLEALERRNQLLEAALMAVLKTGGTLNGCPCHVESPSSDHPAHVDRGGLFTHGSIRSTVSSTDSGASALNMYLSTRGK